MRAGELWGSSRVVAFETLHPGETLFLRKIFQDTARYKYKNLLEKEPDIIFLGSSRIMQFRQEMFGPDTTFYNAGGLGDTILDFQAFWDILPPDDNLKIIFVGMDSYNFGQKRILGEDLKKTLESKEYLSPANWQPYIYAARYLALEIIKNPKRIYEFLNPKDPIGGKIAIGLAALDGDGFRSDGSFQYGSYILARRKDPKFVDADSNPIISRVRNGTGQFKPDSSFDPERMEILKRFLETARKRNIFVIGLALPYSSEVYRELITSPHQKDLFHKFRTELPEVFREEEFPFFDFSDISVLGLNDQYMFDGFHPTESAAAVMLKYMLSSSQLQNTSLFNKKTMVAYLDRQLRNANTKPFEIEWR